MNLWFEHTREWELSFLDFIQDLRFPLLDKVMIFFSKIGDVGAVWIAIGLILLFIKGYRHVGIAALLALLIGTIITDMTLKDWIGRERPFTFVEGLELIIDPHNSKSFPSGHTTASFSAAFVLAYYLEKYRIPVLILAGLISFSRMYLYVHFPTDILAGILVGLMASFLAITIILQTQKLREQRQKLKIESK